MIFFGRRASQIGQLDITKIQCSHCGKTGTQRVHVFGKYAHIYWIPFFPMGRVAMSECVQCKSTISQIEFPYHLASAYQEHKHLIKRPFWHWSLFWLLGFFAIFIWATIRNVPADPRGKLLKNDIARMSAAPTMQSDSISYLLKILFNDFISEEMNPSEFKYLTKTQGNKTLILVRIPDLKKVKKEGRVQVIEMIEALTNAQPALKDMEKYIGVHGNFNMMIVKTPKGIENQNFVLDDALYDFYGPKPEKQREKNAREL